MSGPELARAVDVSASWIRHLETGRIQKPGVDKLQRIAAQLGMDLSPLLAMTDQLGALQVVKEEPGPSPDVTGLVGAMTSALLAQTQALMDLRADLIAAHEDAAREREAMTRMLARLEARLAESLPLADRGATDVARSEAAG